SDTANRAGTHESGERFMNIWKFLTPGLLVLAGIGFVLPCIEVKANLSKDELEKVEKMGGGLAKLATEPLIRQSGIQAATGNYTIPNEELRKRAEAAKEAAKKSGEKVESEGPDKMAVLMLVCLIALVAGIAVGFALPCGKLRSLILIACCGLALGTLVVQAI